PPFRGSGTLPNRAACRPAAYRIDTTPGRGYQERMRRVLVATTIGAAVLLTATAGSSAATERRLVLLPRGTFPASTANAEAARLRRELGIQVSVAPRLMIPTSAR